MLSRLRFWAEHDIAPWSPKPRQESSIRVPKREKVRGFRTVAIGVRGNSTSIVVDPNDGYAKILGSNIEHNAFMAFCAEAEEHAAASQRDQRLDQMMEPAPRPIAAKPR